MKIYINNFNLDALHDTMQSLTEQYISSEIYIQLYSVDGIYKITDCNATKLISNDVAIQLMPAYYKNFTLIVDSSYFIEEITNQIHPEHIYAKIKKCMFKINPKSIIALIIEGEFIEETIGTSKTIFCDIIPNNIYFEISNNIDINNALVKNELIVFLSLLN